MGLLTGRDFVDRLAGLWTGAAPAGPAIAFRQAAAQEAPDALARAHDVYSAADTPDDPTLDWLDSLAASGRQLYLAHAMRRLKAWNGKTRKSQGLNQEATILTRLAAAAGPSSALLEKADVAPLEQAFAQQVARLKACRARSLQEGLTQALALLGASRAIIQPRALEQDAGQLLAAILPILVAADGSPNGPHDLSLPAYAAALAQLYEAETLFPQSPVQEALDRARPFLAMCVDATGHYCFDATQHVPEAVRRTAPLACATVFGAARLAAEKAVLIAGAGGGEQPFSLHLSVAGQNLLHLSMLDGNPAGRCTVASQSTALGHGLEHVAEAASCTAFLNAQGNDFRAEHVVTTAEAQGGLLLTFAPDAKLSLARSGEQATVSLSARQTWQFTLRGARLYQQPEQHTLLARRDETGHPTRINWALKRLSRPGARATGEPIPELPF